MATYNPPALTSYPAGVRLLSPPREPEAGGGGAERPTVGQIWPR